MPSYKINSLVKKKDGPADNPYTVWTVALSGPDGDLAAELFCPKNTQPPSQGSTVDGTIEQPENPNWMAKLKLARAGGGGFGGGGGGRPKDPAERRSIAMQHAQKCAVTILEVAASHGDYKPPSAGDVATQVKQVAAILWQQVLDAEDGKLGGTA